MVKDLWVFATLGFMIIALNYCNERPVSIQNFTHLAVSTIIFQLRNFFSVQNKKPYEGGEIIKQAFLEVTDLRNKCEIVSIINYIQISANTVIR